MAEEVKITELYDGLTADNFHALYLNKKSITIACPENRLQYKDNFPGYCLVLSTLLRTLIGFLSANTFNMLEKLTFEDIPVSGLRLQNLLHSCSTFLPCLRSITIRRNCTHIRLFDAFAFEGPSIGIDNEGYDLYNHTYKLPGNSALETISFEPGVKESTEDDLETLNDFVGDNCRIKSIKVLNSEIHVKQLTIDSPKKQFLQKTLNTLYRRHCYGYRVCPLISRKLKVSLGKEEVELKPWLLSHVVAKLLSASGPGIFGKVHHNMAYDLIRSNTHLLVSCLTDDAKNDAVDDVTL
jgi:hypothetical protein